MRKLKTRLFTGLLAVMMCCTALTPAAFAYAEDPETSEEPVTGGVEPEPLTPEGNLTIVDDIEGDAAGDKQFITVQTKGGNTFYIIVDRAADGENTVYFLNAVDEADLLALMEDGEPAACSCTEKCAAGAVNTACPVCAVNMTECAGKEPEPTPEPEETPEPEKEAGGLNPAVLLAVLVLLGGGGALAYFKLVKGKQASTRGRADLDDYDYGEDEEDADVEPDEPETEDEEL